MIRQTLALQKSVLVALLLASALPAQTGLINTVAGNGTAGTGGIGGPAVNAQIGGGPVWVDGSDNLYIADGYRVVRVDAASGIVTLVAGNGSAGSSGDGGLATLASLNATRGLAMDAAGNIFVAEMMGQRVRRIDAQTGIITTVAGNGTAAFSGDGGPAVNASLKAPFGLAIDAAGNLYIADAGNARVRRVDAQTGVITTVAGNGASGVTADGVPAINASLSPPFSVSLDQSGNVLIPEYGSASIRRVDAGTGLLGTIAGNGNTGFTGDGVPATAAGIGNVAANVAFDTAGNMFFADGTGRIRRVDAATGVITTVAGNGSGAQGRAASGGGGGGSSCYTEPLGDNGPATSATLDGPYGVGLTSNGNVIVADAMDCRVRRVYLPSPYPYTNTTLSLSSSSLPTNTPVTFTAAVTPIGTSGVPSGSVQFVDQPPYLGTTVLGSVPLVNGTASMTINTPPSTGSHLIVAYYGGDGSYNGSGSPGAPLTVTSGPAKPAPTVRLFYSQNPTPPNTPVTFTVTVTPPSGYSAYPTGTVTVFDGATQVGSGSLQNGTAQFSVSFTTSGTHSLTANYYGDVNYSNAQSAALNETVLAAAPVSLTSSVNPSTAGSAVTFTATVTPSTATGTVQFTDSGVSIGTVTLANGQAVLTVSSLALGTHLIQAAYSGDGTYAAATSPVLAQTVKTATTTTVTSSALNSTYGQTITLTASVSPASATGTVEFFDSAASLGVVTLSGGTAAISGGYLTAGTHSIRAVYGGDASNAGSTSATITQTVAPATPAITVTTLNNPVTVGASVLFNISITPAPQNASVSVMDGQSALGTVPVSGGGTASYSTAALTAGYHSITVTWAGDANVAAGTSAVLTETVQSPTTMTETAAGTLLYGQPITFTATISPAAATGSIQFNDAGTNLGTAALSGGRASLTVPSLNAGNHQVAATYATDGIYLSSSATVSIDVAKVNTAAALAASPNPSTVGQAVTLTATVTPGAATGTVQFLDGATAIGSAPVANGTASMSTSTLTAGSHSLTAVYSGDGNYNGSTSVAVAETVKTATSSTLSADVTSPAFGQTVNLTATVAPAAATGTVQFLDGAMPLGTVALSGGAASLSVSTLAVGAHPITAAYSGDANYVASTSGPVAVTVSKAGASVAVTSSLNPSAAGQAVTFTATVTPASATGSVQFKDGSTVLGTVAVSGGAAAFSTSALGGGNHSITATYSGDANYSGASAGLTQTVKAAAAVSLSASSTSITVGQAVTLTATVTPAAATGTVQFLDGATVLGSAAVSSGTAVLSVSTLAVGTHSLTAVYSGDGADTGGTSGAVAVTVSKINTSVTVGSSLNPSLVGRAVTFTATVTPASATGSVQFKDGSTVLGTVAVSAGSAALTVSSLAAGTHSITAVYGGDANDAGSTSAVYTETVNAPPGAPSALTAAAVSSSQINLSWTASPTSGVTYSVYSSGTSGFTPSTANRIASGLTATSYSNTGLPAATTRYYLVTAVNANGESAPSNQASATTQAGLSCHVVYTVTTQWNVGFGTAITIKNTGSTAINGWTLSWTWPGNQQITQAWNSNYTQHGTSAALTNASWNPTIAPGATLSGMGFNASYSGSNVSPTAFYVNGTLCQ
ncbi:MAG TPA: Ig-like domain repeat protein [Candidatus Acidoferrales bacterium]|nr:Ig-like domain repeat protein [Candidatus Acidoferrales bacterium]